MSEKSWKRVERRIVALLGGRRVPVSGRQHGDVPDIAHSTLSIEVKSRKSIPTWLEIAIQQAEAAAKDSRLPMVVLHQTGRRYKDALVVLHLCDFASLLKKGDSDIERQS